MENSVHSEICGNNNLQLHMAIADLFHCENIQDRAVKSHWFATLISKERRVGNDFKCPNKKKAGGKFLDHNYRSCSDQNRIIFGKDSDIFGLSWMSDGAKISRMPLVNNLVMCADVTTKVVDIHDCTDHMAAGSKKDAKYLAGVMEEQIVKIYPERMHTNVFYFDGAANIQKGGLRLCSLYPRAYVFIAGITLFQYIFLIFQR